MSDPWLERFEEGRKNRRDADRTIHLLGEDLTLRPAVAAQVAIRFGELGRRWNDYLARFNEAKQKGSELPTDAGIQDEEMFAISDATIRACIERASWAAWERLCGEDADDPLAVFEIFRLADWFLAKVAALPTDAPSASANGRATTNHSSTAASGSPAKTRKRSASAAT